MNKLFHQQSDHPLFRYFTDKERERVERIAEVKRIADSPRSVSIRAWNKRALSEALAFEPQLLAKFSVAMCELLVERLRDTAKRV